METIVAGVAALSIVFLYVHGKATKVLANQPTSMEPPPPNADGGGEASPSAPPLMQNTLAFPTFVGGIVPNSPSSTPPMILGTAGFNAPPADGACSSAGTIGPVKAFALHDSPVQIAMLGNPALGGPSMNEVVAPNSFGAVKAPSALDKMRVSAPPPTLLRPIMSGNGGATTISPANFPPAPIQVAPLLATAPGNVNIGSPPPPAAQSRMPTPPPPLIQRAPGVMMGQVKPVRNNPPPVLTRA